MRTGTYTGFRDALAVALSPSLAVTVTNPLVFSDTSTSKILRIEFTYSEDPEIVNEPEGTWSTGSVAISEESDSLKLTFCPIVPTAVSESTTV